MRGERQVSGMETVFGGDNRGTGGGDGGVEEPDMSAGTGWCEITMYYRGGWQAANGG